MEDTTVSTQFPEICRTEGEAGEGKQDEAVVCDDEEEVVLCGGGDETAADAHVNTSSEPQRRMAKVVAREYFEESFESPEFVSAHRDRYGDVRTGLDHVGMGIWLDGISQYIEDARDKLVGTDKMSMHEFEIFFTPGRLARGLVDSTAAADGALRESQGCSPDVDTSCRGTSWPVILRYLCMSHDKQFRLVHFARMVRARKKTEEETSDTYAREIRHISTEIAILRSRFDCVEHYPGPEEAEYARGVWNDVWEATIALLARRNELFDAEEITHAIRINNLMSGLELLRQTMRRAWKCCYDFMVEPYRPYTEAMQNVNPETTTSQVPQTKKTRKILTGNKGKPVDQITDKVSASDRAIKSVAFSLEKWEELFIRHMEYVPRYVHSEGDEKLNRIESLMNELSSELDAYFREKPQLTGVCFAAFSRGINPGPEVFIEGILPESYEKALYALLRKLVGAVRDSKPHVRREENEKEEER